MSLYHEISPCTCREQPLIRSQSRERGGREGGRGRGERERGEGRRRGGGTNRTHAAIGGNTERVGRRCNELLPFTT